MTDVMTQFIVPQFIDVEPKIFGPITMRQFILVVVGGVIEFLVFRFGDIPFFLFVTVIVGGSVLLFGFLKINGAPFHHFLLNLITRFKKPGLRVWNKTLSDQELRLLLSQPSKQKIQEKIKRKEMISGSRLAELSLIVDTRGEYKGE